MYHHHPNHLTPSRIQPHHTHPHHTTHHTNNPNLPRAQTHQSNVTISPSNNLPKNQRESLSITHHTLIIKYSPHTHTHTPYQHHNSKISTNPPPPQIQLTEVTSRSLGNDGSSQHWRRLVYAPLLAAPPPPHQHTDPLGRARFSWNNHHYLPLCALAQERLKVFFLLFPSAPARFLRWGLGGEKGCLCSARVAGAWALMMRGDSDGRFGLTRMRGTGAVHAVY